MWRVPSLKAYVFWLSTFVLIFVLIVATAFNAERGAPGGPTADFWNDISNFLQAHGTALDQLWKFLGGIGTILSGCWAIYKSWRFAESNMPKRIEEFLLKCDERLNEARPILLALVESPRPNLSFRTPIALVEPLNIALRKIRYGKVDQTKGDLEESIALLTKQKERWEQFDGQINKQLVAALLLRGTALAAQASMLGIDLGRPLDKEAFDLFDRAVGLNIKDSEALYFRGRQSMRLGQNEVALADFKGVALLTDGKLSVVRARALYSWARLITAGNDPAWRAALLRMAACIKACPDTFKHGEEYAEMNEFRGKVQEENKLPAAPTASYQAAATVFVALNTSRARDGLQRVQRALNRLQLVELAGENAQEIPQQ